MPASARTPASSTRFSRASLASAVGLRPLIRRSRISGGASLIDGNGGSCDRPPDAANKHSLARTHREATDGFTELPGTTVGRNGRCGSIHEDRQDRDGLEIAKDRFPHLDETVIDRHAVRHRDVEVLRPYVVHKLESRLFRHVQRTRPPSPITEGNRSRTDAERRHQIVEEAVEVVGRKLDDVVGRELLHEASEPLERRSNALLGFVAGGSPVHEGCMGSADDGD